MAFENLKSDGIKYVLTKLKDIFVQIKDAVKTVNGNEPDSYGDVTISTVPFAQNLESESNTRNEGTFVLRTAGGESSINNGEASLLKVLGNNVHTGYSPEIIQVSVSNDSLNVSLDRDAFVSGSAGSGTYTFTYTTGWSNDPEAYGITVTGTPENGDVITVEYVEEERGTITVATPTSFTATGWNLYNHAAGSAKVVKYSNGYKVSGAYTALQFSETLNGARSNITVTNGNFDVPSDGYVWVTGGNGTTTAIWAKWEDWTTNYAGDFEAYKETVIDFSTQMSTNFPYGLMKAGNVVDEIDFNVGQIYSRVERMDYDDTNIEAARASGLQFEYDENFIYIAKQSVTPVSFSVSSVFNSNDHGIEYFSDTDVGATAQIVYGGNLKNKLERDVLTLSQQSLNAQQRQQVQANLGLTNTINAVGRINALSLATTTAITSSYVTYNTYSGRKFSDYQFVLVVARRGKWVLGSTFMLRNTFVNNTGAAILTRDGSTNIEFDVKYKSDTSYQAKYISSSTGETFYVEIIGISLTA